MKAARPFAVLLTLVILILPSVAAADVIVLKNKHRVEGKIVEETEHRVKIMVKDLGTITIGRSEIKEIIYSEPETGKTTDAERSDLLRIEDSFLWSGTRRLGTRSVRLKRLENGNLTFQEDVVFYDEKGREEVREFLIETVKQDLEPLKIVYRMQSKDGLTRMTGEVREGHLHLALSVPGERRHSKLKLPEGVRFPLSGREQALRERKRIRGSYVLPVFDPREENFYKHEFTVSPAKKLSWGDGVKNVSVLLRIRGSRTREEIWVDGSGNVLTEQVNGKDVTAVLTTSKRLQAFKEGKRLTDTKEEERVRPLFVHPEAGFRLRKPSLSWEYKKVEPGSRQVVNAGNVRYFAYFEIHVLDEVPEGGLLSSLAVDMEKKFRVSSKDFEKQSEGFLEVGGVRAYRMEATSTNKGEKLRSWLVGIVHGEQTWLLTMATPTRYWKGAVPDFEAFLTSFEFIEEEEEKPHEVEKD